MYKENLEKQLCIQKNYKTYKTDELNGRNQSLKLQKQISANFIFVLRSLMSIDE